MAHEPETLHGSADRGAPGRHRPRLLAQAPGKAKPTRPPPPSARDAALEAWYWQTEPPIPTWATSPPNGAITGLDLFLAIGGAQNLTFDIPALGWDVHLEVTSV